MNIKCSIFICIRITSQQADLFIRHISISRAKFKKCIFSTKSSSQVKQHLPRWTSFLQLEVLLVLCVGLVKLNEVRKYQVLRSQSSNDDDDGYFSFLGLSFTTPQR